MTIHHTVQRASVVLLVVGVAVAWSSRAPGLAAADPGPAGPTPPIEEAFRKAALDPAVVNVVWRPAVLLEPAASGLAKAYGATAAPLLKTKLKVHGRETLGSGLSPEHLLAAVTLAKLADDMGIANYLRHHRPKEMADQQPLSHLIAYFPTKAREATLDTLLREQRPPTWAVHLAAVAGGAESLEQIEGRLAWHGSDYELAASAAAAAIRRRLARPAADQEAWVTGGLTVWKVNYEDQPNPRALEIVPGMKARALRDAGLTVPVAFLRACLAGQAAPGFDPCLIVAIAGRQRENALIEDLLGLAKGSDRLALFAQRALGDIGTDKALRGIESLLVPGAERRGVRNNVMETLIGQGDVESLAVLARAQDDPRFSVEERQSFNDACRRLRARLEAAKPK